eukprot:CAMPEP_0172482720 /NCGR_PEP_ID=MMETSP1066-20121228/9303_1 /TAXON_ID=671091 /ORGANISM="Coscinodiscus wailesii, Strain CCMP2513" /LENGTH=374 /DNA_ID=CAMNT_0013246077 /DNA_START=64 /DNA_END=1184 /DNA_ORIENTATION=+
MRHDPPETTSSTQSSRRSSWRELKNEGRAEFNENRFHDALTSYRTALTLNPPAYERQVLLSNVVACRLKIGGRAQASAALEDARQCVAINDRWAKGHVRLASAYIALNKSNDACNALQRALTLDPTNQTARSMLTQELRRDRTTTSTAAANDAYAGASAPPPPEETTPHPHRQEYNDVDDGGGGGEGYGATSSELIQRVHFYWERLRSRYAGLNGDVKTLLKVLVGLSVLYVGFGGRFGLSRGTAARRGNYGNGNAYDRYYGGRRRPVPETYDDEDPYDDYDPYDDRGRRTTTSSDYEHTASSHRGSSTSFGIHFPDLFDGSLPSMMCIFAILYAAHKYAGIQPFHALMMLNMVTPGRGRMRMGHGRMRGLGMG